MTILSDKTITRLCTPPYLHEHKVSEEIVSYESNISQVKYDDARIIDNQGRPMITPFVNTSVRVDEHANKIISYGLSSYGYDVRLSDASVKVFTNANGTIIDPMALDEACLVDAEIKVDEQGHKFFILPPSSYALGYTMEYFYIPRKVSVVCMGKSTLARAGAIVNVTPIESEFEGNVVIEISNGSTLPIKIYLGMGIAQFQFLEGNEACEVSYADRSGKYQGQTGITLSKV